MGSRTKEQAQRLAAAVVAAVVAIVFIMPVARYHSPPHYYYVDYLGLLPAAAAWLLVWKVPGTHGLALFRTVMLTIVLVGLGGLGLRAVSGLTPAWIEEAVESARFVPQAIAYIFLGVLGLALSRWTNEETE